MGQQQELRRAAAKAFIESLEHLQQTLESADEPVPPPAPVPEAPRRSLPPDLAGHFDLESLEDAIADIEQFMGDQP